VQTEEELGQKMSAPLTVLLVEDDRDTRENVADILELDGHCALLCANCQEALQAINAMDRQQLSSLAVIVDWRLPDGDADQLILKMLVRVPDLPIVVVTGYRELDTSISALRAGAYDYILKPINPDVLRSTLQRIAERWRHLQQIEAGRNMLVQKERLAAIGQMVAGLAHESRNALQRSQACLDNLSLDLQNRPESLLLVERIQKALDDLRSLYEEVRDYAAPIVLKKQSANIVDLIQQIWQELTHFSKANLQFMCEQKGDEEIRVSVDASRIEQVFRNLLENAMSACGESGAIRVSVSIENQEAARNRWARIDIADNGPGFDPDIEQQLFEPFFTTKTKGTGLGLAIVRRIVEAHGGSVHASRQGSGGAMFTVCLPLVELRSGQ
jgi:signal transduction histidine kinase